MGTAERTTALVVEARPPIDNLMANWTTDDSFTGPQHFEHSNTVTRAKIISASHARLEGLGANEVISSSKSAFREVERHL